MFSAVIHDYLGADYCFKSHSFKWCFKQAIAFAKQALYLHEFFMMIDIYLDKYVICVYRGYYDVRRIG